MSAVLAIARRELASYFRLPAGWMICALFLFLTGVVLGFEVLVPGAPASMRTFFGFSVWLLLPVAPAVSMRLVSEELRSGTIEPLMTSPVPDFSVILGKYLGALGFLTVMLLPTLAHAVLLFALADPPPDIGPIAAGYLMLLLTGGLFLSIGLFISTMTANQTLAFLASFFALLGLLLGTNAAATSGPEFLRPLALAFSVPVRAADFSKGVVDTGHVAFFALVSAWMLVLSLISLQSRRWR